ncbi:MAG: flagellar motor protein MotB, partial [Phycisphaeraceae bacterium]|nr:flagellar motor protein MotB [Phycisphaeraceae bacterium]
MARKPAAPPAGAPEWVLTYGDMMSLLLCFFIMLVALSEIKEEDKFKAIATEIQKAFGIQGGASGTNPTDAAKNLIKVLESMAA